jgi:hypothetical protein
MSGRLTAVGRATGVVATRTDLWNVGGTYVFPAAPVQMSVVSSSVNDTAAGTGVRTIVIIYLDNNFLQMTTNVTMNGTTPVLTTPTNILRVLKVFTTTAGVGASAAGNITISNAGTTYAQISATYTTSRQAIGTIPGNSSGFITDVVFSAASTAVGDYFEVDLRIAALDTVATPGVFITVATFGVSLGVLQQVCNPPIYVPPATDMKMTMSRTVGSGTGTCTGSFSGYINFPFIV